MVKSLDFKLKSDIIKLTSLINDIYGAAYDVKDFRTYTAPLLVL